MNRRVSIATVLFSTAVTIGHAVVLPAPASAAEPTCTITGTARNDSLRGTAGRDVICGLGGNDTISGLGGNDIILGGSGNDRIDGGAGDDNIRGDDGDDTLTGGDGNDSISGGDGNDKISGNAGDDTASAETGNDVVNGDAGNDTLTGDAGNDVITGGAGDDRLSGGSGDDRESGDAGADVLWGNAGGDTLAGGAGNDALQGGVGRDAVSPGSGSDQCAVDGEDSVVGKCARDAQSPTLTVLSTPIRANAGETVRFTWRASDVSGVQSTQASIGGPSGWVTQWCGFQVVGTLVKGDTWDGIYAIECAIPKNAPSQEYSLIVSASDNFGNGTDTATGVFTVEGGASDTAVPTIEQVNVAESVTRGDAFTIRVRVTDETGTGYVYGWVNYTVYNVVNLATGKTWVEYLSGPVLVSGTVNDGEWEQELRFRDDSPAGVYTLWFSIGDSLGNRDYKQTNYTVTLLP